MAVFNIKDSFPITITGSIMVAVTYADITACEEVNAKAMAGYNPYLKAVYTAMNSGPVRAFNMELRKNDYALHYTNSAEDADGFLICFAIEKRTTFFGGQG